MTWFMFPEDVASMWLGQMRSREMIQYWTLVRMDKSPDLECALELESTGLINFAEFGV